MFMLRNVTHTVVDNAIANLPLQQICSTRQSYTATGKLDET